MKTVRRKHNRRRTKRRHQRYHRTKKSYQYGGKSIISYQSGGVPPDDPEDIYDAGEDPADGEDFRIVEQILLTNPPESPRVRNSIAKLFKYRFPDAEGRSCMYIPPKNTLIGKMLEEQAAKKLFEKYYPEDREQERFKKYIKLLPTEEYDIPPSLNGGRAVSIKSKRVGMISRKKVTTESACSFQVCSSDAARFMKQMLHGPPLTLLLIYYEITESGIVPEHKQRVYDISSQKDKIWGKYTNEYERQKIVRDITELSHKFTSAQDDPDVTTITANLGAIRDEVARLQQEMADKGCSIKLAHKISSKCGLSKGTCKEQCRLQVVLDVKNLTEQDVEYVPPLSPTAFLKPPPKSRGASVRGRGDSVRGRSASVRGRGASVRGRGDSARGRGDSARGRGDSARGRGDSARGRSANLSGIDEDDMGTSAKGRSSSKGRGANGRSRSRSAGHKQ